MTELADLKQEEYNKVRNSMKCVIFLEYKNTQAFEEAAVVIALREGLALFISAKIPSFHHVSSISYVKYPCINS